MQQAERQAVLGSGFLSSSWEERQGWFVHGSTLIAALLIPTPTLLLYCRSEMRIVHQLSHQLGRDIVLASTSIDTPAAFIEQLRGIALDQGQDV